MFSWIDVSYFLFQAPRRLCLPRAPHYNGNGVRIVRLSNLSCNLDRCLPCFCASGFSTIWPRLIMDHLLWLRKGIGSGGTRFAKCSQMLGNYLRRRKKSPRWRGERMTTTAEYLCVHVIAWFSGARATKAPTFRGGINSLRVCSINNHSRIKSRLRHF